MARLDDDRLQESVTRALESDSRIDTASIDVRVRNGIVYLSGSVDNAAQRHAVQRHVQDTADVVSVVDQITVRTTAKRDDAELREAAVRCLDRSESVEARLISVDVQDGAVTLTGRVPDERQKRDAEDVVWWIPGVADVRNGVEVADDAERSREQE